MIKDEQLDYGILLISERTETMLVWGEMMLDPN